MNALSPAYAAMEKAVRSFADATSPADVFRRLLDATHLLAPRAGVFLVRRGELHGWASHGYEAKAVQSFRQIKTPLDQCGWLGQVATSADEQTATRSGPIEPDFGQGACSDSAACVVRVKGRPLAVVFLERGGGDESPWAPEALGLLGTVAQLRLELDLVLRKFAATQEAAQKSAQPAGHQPAERRPQPAAPTAAPESKPTGVAPAQMAPAPAAGEDDDPRLAAARRYARLVATDIRLYNEEAVAQGQQNGDLVNRLAENLGRGKTTFLKRHGDLGPQGLEILHEACVQVLAGGDASLLPDSALK